MRTKRTRLTSPKVVGLTGGVAAGKSEALAALERIGVPTVSSDRIVHDLLAGDELRDLLTARWGEDVAPGGEVDRDCVGRIVFENPEELAWLESVLHPRVGERLAAWRQALPEETEVAAVEVPLLFETGMDQMFDATIAIAAPDPVREDRIRDRGTGAAAERSGRQLSQDEKVERATHVVVNDGTLADLESRLAALLPRLKGGE
jgi:dephospho-CoA kinase